MDTVSDDYTDALYSLLVRRGYSQHEATQIAYCPNLARVSCNGSGFAVVDQNGGVGDCPGCSDCAKAAPVTGVHFTAHNLLAEGERRRSPPLPECPACGGSGIVRHEGSLDVVDECPDCQ